MRVAHEMALPVQKRSQILKDLQLFCEYLCEGHNVIEITMDDLTNPQAERIQSIYLFFAEHFFPDCAQRLMQSSSVASENLEFPELQADNRISLQLVLGYFFRIIGVEDFQLRDIFEPTSKRTQKLLSNLVNFMKLVALVDESEDMQSVAQEQEDLVSECQQLTEQVAKAEEESNRLWRKRHQDEEVVTNLHFHYEREVQAWDEVSAVKEQVLAELNKYNKECSKATDHVSSLEQQLELKESGRNQLEDQLIQSPEKLSKQVTELHEKATEAKDRSREASDLYTKWQSLSTQTKSIPMTYETIDSAVEGSVNRIEKLNSMSLNTERLQTGIHEKRRMLRDTVASIEHLERKSSSLDQRGQQSEYKKTHPSNTKSAANFERDMQLLTMEEATVYEKVASSRKALSTLQNQVESKTEKHSKFVKELEETNEKVSLMYQKRHEGIVKNHENIMRICGK